MLLPRPAAFGSALFVLVALATGPAHAGLLPTMVTIAPEGGNFRWGYTVVLPGYTKLQSGDYFTIYDFNGLVSGASGAPAGWTLSTPNVGPRTDYISVPDDPTVANLVWTYRGPTRTGRIALGEFWATSMYGESEEGLFVGRNHRTWDGATDTNVTETRVPTPAAPGVPEPGTLLLSGVALSLVGLVHRVRRRKGA